MRQSFDSKQLLDLTSELGLHLVPYKPTHHLRCSSALLDLCITDDLDKIVEFGQQDVAFLSAYDLIYIRYKIKIQRRSGRSVTFRDWRDMDDASFRLAVEGIDWSTLLASDDMDEKVEEFNNKIMEVFNSHVPLKTRLFRNLPAPWLT